MDIHQAGPAEATAVGTARFDYTPVSADYDQALWRFTLGTWPGRTGSLWLPALFAALTIIAGAVRRHLGEGGIVLCGVAAVIAVFVIRQGVRRFQVRGQYEERAAFGTCRTTLSADGLTTVGTAGGEDSADWSAYPCWFETSELFVLTGSLGYFVVLPKRGAASPDDLVVARALFEEHLRRI